LRLVVPADDLDAFYLTEEARSHMVRRRPTSPADCSARYQCLPALHQLLMVTWLCQQRLTAVGLLTAQRSGARRYQPGPENHKAPPPTRTALRKTGGLLHRRREHHQYTRRARRIATQDARAPFLQSIVPLPVQPTRASLCPNRSIVAHNRHQCLRHASRRR